MQDDMNVDLGQVLRNSTPVKCDCGNATFAQSFLLRKVSAIVTGGKTGFIPIPLYTCNACGKPPAEMVGPTETSTTSPLIQS